MLPDELNTGYRALSLGALLLRAQIEHIRGIPEVDETQVARLQDWLEEEGIDERLSPKEYVAMFASLGTWDRQTLIDASWRTEALGMVVWALGFLEDYPAYDRTFTPKAVLSPLRLLMPTGDFFREVRLRPQAEIEKARAIAELWHWRSRTTRIAREGIQPPYGSFDDIIALTARQAYKQGSITTLMEDDFAAFNKPYRCLEREEYTTCTSITIERHFALNWLCGYSDSWDNTPIDT